MIYIVAPHLRWAEARAREAGLTRHDFRYVTPFNMCRSLAGLAEPEVWQCGDWWSAWPGTAVLELDLRLRAVSARVVQKP